MYKQTVDEQFSCYVRAMAAVAAQPLVQVIQHPTAAVMVLYFKKHLQRHMTVAGLAGTEHMSLSSACLALEDSRTTCTRNAIALVARAMEELRQEAEQGEKKTEERLGWDLAHAIAQQHECEQVGASASSTSASTTADYDDSTTSSDDNDNEGEGE